MLTFTTGMFQYFEHAAYEYENKTFAKRPCYHSIDIFREKGLLIAMDILYVVYV